MHAQENNMKKENLPELWEITLRFLYDERYIESLCAFLREAKARSVLDCACGVGFPAVELKQAGLDVYCTDGSPDMIERLHQNLRQAKLKIPHRVLKWDELAKFKRKFDAILCRGNSLAYISSWEVGIAPDYSRFEREVIDSLRAMRAVLRPDGILYVDLAPEHERELHRFAEKTINGQKTRLTWRVRKDYSSKTRTVISIRHTGKSVYWHCYRGVLLEPNDLRRLLRAAGFTAIRKIHLIGEETYDVYIAQSGKH